MPQVKLDFDKMTKIGLKSLVKKFQKYDLDVADIVSDNRAKRQSGFLVKNATLVFESGQKLLIRVKADGTVFQVKLNNKVMPIKHVDDLDKAIIELVDYVQDNEKRYVKAKQKRAEAPKIKVPTIKVRTTRKQQIEQFTGRVAELKAEAADLGQKSETITKTITTKKTLLSDLQAELAALKDKSSELESELQTIETEAA